MRRDSVHKFQEGQKASVMKDGGAEVEMTVFHQSGELVSLFDRANRYYLFHIRNVRPVKSPQSSISKCDPFSESTVRELR
jgi:hypothetical protein